MSAKLVSILEYLNNYSIESIPSKTVGIVNRIVTIVISFLTGLLAWVNHFLLRWDQKEDISSSRRRRKGEPGE
jgi:hypothetical protein